MQDHFSPANLERYSFYWLLALLVLTGAAMFLGPKPLIHVLLGSSMSTMYSLLNLSWIISGVAAVFMAYKWNAASRQVFGGSDTKDMAIFVFMLATGLNIGLEGVLGLNLYFQIFSGQILFMLTGALCLFSAYYLWKRWNENNQVLFASAGEPAATQEESPKPEPEQAEHN